MLAGAVEDDNADDSRDEAEIPCIFAGAVEDTDELRKGKKREDKAGS